MRERSYLRRRALGIGVGINERQKFCVFASSSAFQPVSVGLGFRVIPALGGGTQQFRPYRVSVSLPDCRLRLLQSTKTIRS